MRHTWFIATAIALGWILACGGGETEPADVEPEPGEPGEPASAFVPPPPALEPAAEAAETEVRLLPHPAEPPLEIDNIALPDVDFMTTAIEEEPNNTIDTASELAEDWTAQGTIEGRDEDNYELVIEGDARIWSIEVVGDVHNAEVKGAAGTVAGLRDAGDRRVAHGVYLTPGTYWIEVKGKDSGEYTVRAVPTGAPDRRIEREPNDESGLAHALQIGETRGGWVSPKGDEDVYRFHLSGSSFVRVAWGVSAKTLITLKDATSGGELLGAEVSAPGTWDGYLLPGSYQINLRSREHTLDAYTLGIKHLDPLHLPDDLEPNGALHHKRSVPRSMSIVGHLDEADERDLFALPIPEEDAEIEVRWVADTEEEVSAVGVRVQSFEPRTTHTKYTDENTWTGTIPAGTATWAEIRQEGDYEVHISMSGVSPTPRAPAPDLSLSAPGSITQVAAYRELGQHLEVPITATGSGSGTVETWVSDDRWSVTPMAPEVQAGDTLTVRVDMPDDLDAEGPVWVVVGARAAPDGLATSTAFLVQPTCGVPLVGARQHWDLPEALLGGVNVARNSLGGTLVDDRHRYRDLIDGYSRNDGGYTAHEPESVDIVLAGDRPEIAGFLLDTHGRYGNSSDKDFEIHVSDDGKDWDLALSGTLERGSGEQAFLLDAPRRASHVRLVTLEHKTTIGELKAIATPGSRPLGDELVVSRPMYGGRIVRTAPQMGNKNADMLTPEESNRWFRTPAGTPAEIVVAFEHGRMARIGRIEWEQADDRYPLMSEVAVAVSERTPVGPWIPLGKMALGDKGESATFAPDAPVWARYVRFTNLEEGTHYRMRPQQIRIVEDSDHTVIGEYGKYRQTGPWELEHGIASRAAIRGERGENETIETATPLPLGEPTADQVSVGEDVDVYSVEIPDGHNLLELETHGDPVFNGTVKVTDSKGRELPVEGSGAPDTSTLQVRVEPGPVFVHVEEPPRSVALLWDQSCSVTSFVPQIYGAISEFVEGVEAGKEVANLYPFQKNERGEFLSETWLDEPAALQQVINNYPRKDNSSAAELALLAAQGEMKKRVGTKAILILTDAETHSTNKNTQLWREFAAVRPRVFTMELHIDDVWWHQDLMQGWAEVDAGHYTWFSTPNDLDIAFDRASCHLRRPLDYEILATTRHEAPPVPGTVKVEPTGLDGYAVELILDASGSMLNRIEGKRRIAIARDVLVDLVTETIPPETPLALRAFGHQRAESCQTDLEVPLAPLDPESVAETIGGINAKNRARTPIGDSLLAVERDLADHDGPKLIVLLTDGEETCGGDPEAAILTLEEKGLDVRTNIVGFAIDDGRLASDFEAWALAGGGLYMDASNEEELGKAMLAALSPRYQILSSSGDTVAEGTAGGEAVALPVGPYVVKILTSPVKTVEIEVQSGQLTKVSAGEPEE